MTTPQFIVFEGLDGAGKSTLARRLADQVGADVLSTPLAEFRQIRARVDEALVDPVASSLWYAAQTLEVSRRAGILLARGRSVVVDRYVLSTLAWAQLRRGALDAHWLTARCVEPDLTIFVDANDDVRTSRMFARGHAGQHDSTSLTHSGALRAAYRQAMTDTRTGPVIEIDTSTISEADVIDHLSTLHSTRQGAIS